LSIGRPSAYLTSEKEASVVADPELTARLIATRKAEDTGEIAAVLLDVKRDATSRNEAANLLRRSEYAGLTDRLIESLGGEGEGPLWRSYCVQHLYMNHEGASAGEKSRIEGVLRDSLTDRHTRVRREALLALCRLKEPLGRETAVKWLSAKEGEGARDVAIRCVEELDLRDQAAAIRELVADPDESTAVAAIGVLGRWGDAASWGVIEAAGKSGSARVREAAGAALGRLGRGRVPAS
jgi:hypothetical protein